MAVNTGILSPSTLSDASFDYLSARSPTEFSDVDEIVWSISSVSSVSSISASATHTTRWADAVSSEDDFILVDRGTSDSSSEGSTGSSSPSVSASSDGSVNVEELANRVSSLYLAPYESPETPKPAQASFIPESSSPSSTSSRIPKKNRNTASPNANPSGAKGAAKSKSPRQAGTFANSLPPAAKAEAVKATKNKVKFDVAKRARKLEARKLKKAAKKVEEAVKKGQDPQATANSRGDIPAANHRDSGLGEREIVDDVSEAGEYAVPAVYRAAVNYISSFLSDPSEKSSMSKLRLLQALIIELGLLPTALLPSSPALSSAANFPSVPSLPNSLKAARTLLKSSVFLNVKDYLAVRGDGLDALRGVMHPSRQALIKDVRKNKTRKVPRDVVKGMGLNVLLVTTY